MFYFASSRDMVPWWSCYNVLFFLMLFRQKHLKPLVVCSPMGLCIFVCLIVPVSKLPCRSIVQIYTPCGVQTPSAINLKNNLIIYHFSIYNFLIYCPQITQIKQIFFFLVRQKLSKMIQKLLHLTLTWLLHRNTHKKSGKPSWITAL